jgi:hypothetical protein
MARMHAFAMLDERFASPAARAGLCGRIPPDLRRRFAPWRAASVRAGIAWPA